MKVQALVNGQTFSKETETLQDFISYLTEDMGFNLEEIDKVEKV